MKKICQRPYQLFYRTDYGLEKYLRQHWYLKMPFNCLSVIPNANTKALMHLLCVDSHYTLTHIAVDMGRYGVVEENISGLASYIRQHSIIFQASVL